MADISNNAMAATDEELQDEMENLGGNGQRSSGQLGGQSSSQAGSKRGFAAMSEADRKRIASKGGQAAHAKGTAHEWDSEEASEAGRKGGSK